MLWLPTLLTSAHIYTYACRNKCCHLDTDHVVDQPTPFHVHPGEWSGIEIPLKSVLDPAKHVDRSLTWNAAFKSMDYDLSTYRLYIGCGGCASNTYPDHAEEYGLEKGFERGKVDPFTQTRSYGVVFEEDRTFLASEKLSECAAHNETMFSIRLWALPTATGKTYWQVSLRGLPPTAWLFELYFMPVHILSMHGIQWTRLGWTFPLILGSLLIVAFLLGILFSTDMRDQFYQVLCCCGYGFGYGGYGSRSFLNRSKTDPIITRPDLRSNEDLVLKSGEERVIVSRARPYIEWRRVLYLVAIVSFSAALIEIVIHLYMAQHKVEQEETLWTHGVLLMMLAANVAPILFVLLMYGSMFLRPVNQYRDGQSHWCTAAFWGHPVWCVPELLIGLALPLLLGSGFFLGPVCIALAGLVRMFTEWIYMDESTRPKPLLFSYEPQVSDRDGVSRMPVSGLSQGKKPQVRNGNEFVDAEDVAKSATELASASATDESLLPLLPLNTYKLQG
jgi:hypothetical protein